jgi:membrane protease subunit (stomatin/prohibitin family)
MGLFNKNDNESNYIGGEKHWVDVIKSDNLPNESFPAGAMVWKHPAQDFNTKSTLTVLEGEVAIFLSQGEFSETFNPGTYQLDTQNYPFISRLRNAFSDGVSTFSCFVIFMKTTPSQMIPWGTQSPIEVLDYSMKDIARKGVGTPVNIKANGAYRYVIKDPTLFISGLVGAGVEEFNQEDIRAWFDSQMQSIIQNDLSTEVQKFSTPENEAPIIDSSIKQHLKEYNDILTLEIGQFLGEKGIKLDDFSVANLVVRDTDRSLLWKANADKVNEMGMMKSAYDELGTNFREVKQFDIYQAGAENPGGTTGNMMGAGLGMAMGVGMAQSFTPTMQNAMQPTQNTDDPIAKLTNAKKALDAGLITQQDYDKLKSEAFGL